MCVTSELLTKWRIRNVRNEHKHVLIKARNDHPLGIRLCTRRSRVLSSRVFSWHSYLNDYYFWLPGTSKQTSIVAPALSRAMRPSVKAHFFNENSLKEH